MNSNVSIKEQLDVSNNAEFRSRVDITGDVSMNNNVSIQQKLDVTNDTLLKSRVDIVGDVSMNSNVSISEKLDVSNNADFRSRVDITGDVSMNNNVSIQQKLDVTNDTLLKSRVDIVGDVSMNNNVSIKEQLDVSNNAEFRSRVDITGDVSMNNNVSIQQKLDVTNDTLLKSRVDIVGDVSMNSNVSIKEQLDVSNNAEFRSRVDITGDVSMNNNVSIQQKLDVTNDTLLKSRVDILGDVSMNSNLSISEKLDVSNNAEFRSRVDITGDVSMNNNVSIQHNLDVSNIKVYHDVDIDGKLTAGSFSIDNGLLEIPTIKVTTLEVGGNTTMKGTLDVSGNTTLDGTLDVSGQSKFHHTITVLKDASFNKDLYVSNQLDVSAAFVQHNLEVSGNMIINNNRFIVDASGNVGIHNHQPRVALDLSGATDAIQLPVGNSSQRPSESIQTLGQIRYNTETHQFEGYGAGDVWSSLGGGLIKEKRDASANILLVEETGDLYYNETDALFKYYVDSTSKWMGTALGRIAGQPPPIMDISAIIRSSMIELYWINPKQVPTSITSQSTYASENSPASNTNPSTGQSIVYFPIVNRMVLKINKVDANGNVLSIVDYPLYQITGTSTTQYSQKDGSANVIYRKGDTPCGTTDATRNSYIPHTTPTNMNELEHMPNRIQIFKRVPNTSIQNSSILNPGTNVIQSFTDIPALELDDSDPNTKYRFDIWLENNSLDDVHIASYTTTLYPPANAPDAAKHIDMVLGQKSDTSMSANTQVKIDIVDPSFVAGSQDFSLEEQYLLTFEGIKFEWSQDNTTWYPFDKIRGNEGEDYKVVAYDNSTNDIHVHTLDNNGILSINRLVDPSNNSSTRYYTFDISSSYLGNNYQQPTSSDPKLDIHVRISYKNASNSAFGPTIQDSIHISKPSKPIISDVKMISTQKLRITIPPFTDSQDTMNQSNSPSLSTNNNYAVYVRDVDISGIGYNNTNGSSPTPFGENIYQFTSVTQDASSNYILTIVKSASTYPDTKYIIKLQVRVKNNIIDDYSEYTNEYLFEINKVDTNNTIADISYQPLGSITNQDQLYVQWNHPNPGDRGVAIQDLFPTTLEAPTISEYDITSSRPDVSTANQIQVNNVNTQTGPLVDASNTLVIDIRETIMKGGSTNGVEKEINVLVKQRNEYVTTPSDISRNLYYSLGEPSYEPSLPTIDTSTFSITNQENDKNSLTLTWNRPTDEGFKTSLVSGALSQTKIAINRYNIDIEANRIGSGSAYYRSLPSLADQPIISAIDVSNGEDVDANTYITGSNGIIDQSSNMVNTSGSSITDTTKSNVLVYPNTEYTVSIKPRNRYMIETGLPFTTTITTTAPEPPTDTSSQLFTDTTLPQHEDYDLIGVDNYSYKGFLLNKDDPNNTNVTPSYFITNTTTLHQTKSAKHRMNKEHFMNFLSPTIYIGDTASLDANANKIRQFRVYNEASNNEVLYIYGNDTNNTYTPTDASGAMSQILTMRRVTGEDEDPYSRPGFDNHNQGYWWNETIEYDLSFANPTAGLFGVPLKLKLNARYNDKLTDSTTYTESSLDTDADVIDASRIILQNSYNSNVSNNVYFDDLNQLPDISVNTDINGHYLTSYADFSNNINGIPNIYPFQDAPNSIQFTLDYKVMNFSNHYALDQNDAFIWYEFEDVKNDIQPISWTNKDEIKHVRSVNYWNINDVVTNMKEDLSGVNASTNHASNLIIHMRNTFGESEHVLTSATSDLYQFVFDKNSVLVLENDVNIMNVSDNFDPISSNTTYSNDFTESIMKNNRGYRKNQLFLFDGKFMTETTTEASFNEILKDNTTKLSYGIPITIPEVPTTDYRWSIFKYSNSSLNNTPLNTFFFSFGDDTKTNISIDDIITSEDVQIYLQVVNGGSSTLMYGSGANSYKWVSYSGNYSKDITIGKTSESQISKFIIEQVGNLQYDNATSNSDWKSASPSHSPTSINTSALSSYITNRTYWGVFNKQTVSNNSSITFYLAIGLKKDKDLFITKPPYIYTIQSYTENTTNPSVYSLS